MSRKLPFLFGAVLLFMASGAVQAQSGYGDDRYAPNDRYDDRYASRSIIRCESRERRTIYCSADTRGGVQLVDQLSDRRCVRGRTWGTDRNRIWVSDGCRGDFQVNRSRSDDRYGSTIRCESRDSRTVMCRLNHDNRGIKLVSQHSRDACVQGRSWGVAREGVWVSRGCRATFRAGGGYEYGYGDDDRRYDDRY